MNVNIASLPSHVLPHEKFWLQFPQSITTKIICKTVPEEQNNSTICSANCNVIDLYWENSSTQCDDTNKQWEICNEYFCGTRNLQNNLK